MGGTHCGPVQCRLRSEVHGTSGLGVWRRDTDTTPVYFDAALSPLHSFPFSLRLSFHLWLVGTSLPPLLTLCQTPFTSFCLKLRETVGVLGCLGVLGCFGGLGALGKDTSMSEPDCARVSASAPCVLWCLSAADYKPLEA